MPKLSISSFNKWRCLIALAHVDLKLQPSEKDFFSFYMNKIGVENISKQEMDIFKDDIKNRKDPAEFFDGITDELDKIDLLSLSYELFWCDGEFAEKEQKAFKKIRNAIAKSFDVSVFLLDDLIRLRKKKMDIYQIVKKASKEIF